jgi:hypothetical protein
MLLQLKCVLIQRRSVAEDRSEKAGAGLTLGKRISRLPDDLS